MPAWHPLRSYLGFLFDGLGWADPQAGAALIALCTNPVKPAGLICRPLFHGPSLIRTDVRSQLSHYMTAITVQNSVLPANNGASAASYAVIGYSVGHPHPSLKRMFEKSAQACSISNTHFNRSGLASVSSSCFMPAE